MKKKSLMPLILIASLPFIVAVVGCAGGEPPEEVTPEMRCLEVKELALAAANASPRQMESEVEILMELLEAREPDQFGDYADQFTKVKQAAEQLESALGGSGDASSAASELKAAAEALPGEVVEDAED